MYSADIPVDPSIPGLSPRDRRPPVAPPRSLDEGDDRTARGRRRLQRLRRAIRRFDPELLHDIGLDQASG